MKFFTFSQAWGILTQEFQCHVYDPLMLRLVFVSDAPRTFTTSINTESMCHKIMYFAQVCEWVYCSLSFRRGKTFQTL